MTANVLYLLAGIAIGIPTTVLWQRHRTRVESLQARRQIRRRRDINTSVVVAGPWPERGWHPSAGRPQGPAA